jgi:hypothetical protein
MEILQHNSPNTDFIRREFRQHDPSPVTASGEVQARINSPLRYRGSWPCLHGVLCSGCLRIYGSWEEARDSP